MGRNPDPTFAEVQGVQSIIAKLLQKVAKNFVQTALLMSLGMNTLCTKHFVPNYVKSNCGCQLGRHNLEKAVSQAKKMVFQNLKGLLSKQDFSGFGFSLGNKNEDQDDKNGGTRTI